MSKTIITFGTYDLFHIGHLQILERASALGQRLVVGVSSDALSYEKKASYPIYNENDRMRIVEAIACVDQVFLEESLEQKAEYISKYSADKLVMGDDWAGKFDCFSNLTEVIYLPRTAGISTTFFKELIRS